MRTMKFLAVSLLAVLTCGVLEAAPKTYGLGKPAVVVADEPDAYFKDAANPVTAAGLEAYADALLAGGKEDGTAVPFTLKGSKTGEDGTGWSTNRFVSTSGRVVIEPSYWMSKFWWGYHKVKPEAGYEVRWECLPMVEETYAPGERGTMSVLVQNCPNGRHVLELRPRQDGPLGIASFTVCAPRSE